MSWPALYCYHSPAIWLCITYVCSSVLKFIFIKTDKTEIVFFFCHALSLWPWFYKYRRPPFSITVNCYWYSSCISVKKVGRILTAKPHLSPLSLMTAQTTMYMCEIMSSMYDGWKLWVHSCQAKSNCAVEFR